MNGSDTHRVRLPQLRIPQIIAAATTAAILGTAGVSIAGAATSGSSAGTGITSAAATATAAPKANANARALGKHRWLRRLGRRAVGLSAKTINIPRADLVKDMRAGKTIGEVATAHGVQPQTVVDALVKAGQARLDKAKAAGKLSTDRYNRLEQRLPQAANRFVTQFHLKNAG